MQASTIRIEELREKILEAERANTQLHSDIAVYENDIEHCNEAISDIENQQKNAENSGEENRRIIEEKQALVKKADEDIADSEKEYAKTSEELNTLISEQDSFDSKYSDVSGNLNKLYIKKSELNITITSGDSGKAELEEQLKQSRAMEEQLRINSEELTKEKKEIEREMYHTLQPNYLYYGSPDKNFVYYSILTHTCVAIRKIYARHGLSSDELKTKFKRIFHDGSHISFVTNIAPGENVYEAIASFIRSVCTF